MSGYELRDENDNRWWINRNGGVTVYGDWEPVNSWSGSKILFPGVVAHVYIYGQKKHNSFGCKPRSWSGDLSINHRRYTIPTTHRSCKSIKDACLYAERSLTDEFIIDRLKAFYTQRNALCISKLDKSGNPIPLVTTFWKQDWMKLECGTYVIASKMPYNDYVSISTIERFHMGYAGGSYKGNIVPQWVNYDKLWVNYE